MSARVLNLLAEPTDVPKTSVPSDQSESSECPLPVPPPGLEKFGPTQPTGQLAKASVSEVVEDACLSSSDSTRFEEDGDADPNTWYSQDWELSAWGQSYTYPTPAPETTFPPEAAILSTTPLRPPTLSTAPPASAPPMHPPQVPQVPHAPPAWEWHLPHGMPHEALPYDMLNASAGYEHFPEAAMMTPMMPPMVHGVHYPPEAPYLSYPPPVMPIGPELQSQGTLGSAGHEIGNCKPCAFVYTKGCQSGAFASQTRRVHVWSCHVLQDLLLPLPLPINLRQCAFCHLCPPGEKDRRKKVKHIMARREKTSDSRCLFQCCYVHSVLYRLDY